ncbi:MAG: PilT/PilU family type 4a pilus ATPase [Clostridiales bacterium]|nr:PilT/PilU family type 4a pilus ATPase [Candidatus Crickella merdequi]
MNLNDILVKSVNEGVSDIFIVAGLPVSVRKNGSIVNISPERIMPSETRNLLSQIYEAADNRDLSLLETNGDDDFSFSIPGLSRFRVSAYKQRGALSAVIRVITFTLPNPAELGIPDNIVQIGNSHNGMILVTGAAGSGKSTTLACIVDYINHNYNKHIITLEDPIEHLHRHNKSIVSQRELGVDTESYVKALRASLRQSPDVILLGEMRDYETISVAMTAAETGHMVLSSLHTMGAANTIDRIIDVFPPDQQRQIAVQLSTVLSAVISQQLVPAIDGSVVPAFEIMTVTPAIRNMIRENKTPQIDAQLYSANRPDMKSMDQSLIELYNNGIITRETALQYATNAELISRKL